MDNYISLLSGIESTVLDQTGSSRYPRLGLGRNATRNRLDESEFSCAENLQFGQRIILTLVVSPDHPNLVNADRVRRRRLITNDPLICNGDPVIQGSRISVVNIIEKTKYLGEEVGKIHAQYPHLNHEQILACLEYYEEHKEEIDRLIEREQIFG